MDVLRLSRVSKSFGSKKVVTNLSFSVPEHSVFGFIGENGAGKTTTMRMILGLLRADRGEILVNGEKVTYGQNRTNRFIGYLPDVPEFYGFLTPKEYLRLCGEVTGMKKKEIEAQSERLLKLVGLSQYDKRIHGFSRGMKQRLGIAQALLNRPRLLICDEPTSALDPVGRREILDILSSVRRHTTVLFSTHILSDVERICDEAAFLHNGRIALRGSIDEIKAARRHSGFEIMFCRAEDARRFAEEFAGEAGGDARLLRFEGKAEAEMQRALRYLAQTGMAVQRIEMLEPSLESLFLEVVGRERL